jgi:20S proteasome alpha/beta subunit
MTLCVILSGTDETVGVYQVFGSDSRAEYYPITTTDRAEKHFIINEKAGICAAGIANYVKEILDEIQDDPKIRKTTEIGKLVASISEKYKSVWERHMRPRRVVSELYARPMEAFNFIVGVGGIDNEPRIYVIQEGGEPTQIIDGYLALGSGEFYAKPRLENLIKVLGGQPRMPNGISNMSLRTAKFGVLYALEEAKRNTSSVGGDSHISAITKKEGWKDLDNEIPSLQPRVDALMKKLEADLIEGARLV